MLRKRFFFYFRLLLILIIGLTLGTVVGGFYYINKTGANEQWRTRIAQELENRGIIADFESLRIEPTRGLVAAGVQVYADDTRQEVIARLEHLVIDVDKTKLLRGKLRVTKISLKKADISLPIDPDDPNGSKIIMHDLQGDILLPDKKTIDARNISGVVAGIELKLNARIWSDYMVKKNAQDDSDDDKLQLKMIARIIESIEQWDWSQDAPPLLTLNLEGNMDQLDSTLLTFHFKADEIARDGMVLNDVKIMGDYKNKVITLDSIHLSDGAGKIDAQADFILASRSGRFSSTSTLHIQTLMRKVFGIDILQEITFSSPPHIAFTGRINLDENFSPQFQVLGDAKVTGFTYLGSQYKKLTTQFSIEGSQKHSNAFFTDLHLTHEKGELKGQILIKDDSIRYEADSSLPPNVYLSFIKEKPIPKALKRAHFNSKSTMQIKAKGTMNRRDFNDWKASGSLSFKHFSYLDTPFHSLSGNYQMGTAGSQYTQVNAHLDYTDYWLRKRHGGPDSARVGVSKITVDLIDKTVKLVNIKATAWPAPIVKIFAPFASKHIETYRFHRPPYLVANGVFGLTKNDSRTNFKIDINSQSTMNYDFLGEPLTLKRLKGKVHIKSNRVEVTNLTFNTFQGPGKGYVTVYTSGAKKQQYSGAFQWSRLHLKDIGKLYEFDADRGLITGRVDFRGLTNNIRKLQGKGDIALERGNLFSVPMLGPLSPLIGNVLGRRNPTQQQAESASCTYIIKNGIIYSNNFLATTRSLKFTGEGKIDLSKKSMDLLMRMNARGLFSVISLPLRPFIGLFQFRGNGYVMDPKWRAVMFTSPKRGKTDPIFTKPPKAKVIRE